MTGNETSFCCFIDCAGSCECFENDRRDAADADGRDGCEEGQGRWCGGSPLALIRFVQLSCCMLCTKQP